MRTLPRSPIGLKDAAVDLRGVTRLFGAAPALVRVDLAIERGEAVVLRGPNGAGKSTLLRIVATALSPTYGGGSVLGFDLAEDARADPPALRAAHPSHPSVRGAHRPGEPRADRRPARHRTTTACRRRSNASRSRTSPTSASERSPPGCGRRSRSRGRSSATPSSCCSTNPRRVWTPRPKSAVDEMMLRASREGRTLVIATHHDVTPGLAARVVTLRDGSVEAGS